LEIADILVVNKADMPLADRTEAQLRDALALGQRGDWDVPVMKTASTTGEGVPELVAEIARHHGQLDLRDREQAARARMRKLIASTAADLLRDRMAVREDSRIDALCDAVSIGDLDFEEAAVHAAKLIAEGL